MAIIPEKAKGPYLQPGLRGSGRGLAGTAALSLGESACTALPPVVFILAMQSEGRKKSPKEWLVAGSKLLPWTALRGDQGTGSCGGRGKSLLGGIRGQLAGRGVQRVRTKCSVCRRRCWVTCWAPAEVMSHGSPPKLQQDLLPLDMTSCQFHSNPQTLPGRRELGEREPCPLAALRGKKYRDFYMLDVCRFDSPTTSLLPLVCPPLCGSWATHQLRFQGGLRPMGRTEPRGAVLEPKSAALHALPSLLHSSPFPSAGAQHQWSHIPVWGPKQESDR